MPDPHPSTLVRLRRLHRVLERLWEAATGPGMARLQPRDGYSAGEIVFGELRKVWFVRADQKTPALGQLLREHFPERHGMIEGVAEPAQAQGARLGAALVERGAFSEEEVLRVLRVQCALGLLEVVQRLESDFEVKWTPLFTAQTPLPAPTLLQAYFAATRRVAADLSEGGQLDRLASLRRLGVVGLAFLLDEEGPLPVRSVGPPDELVDPGQQRALARAARDGPDLRVLDTPAGPRLWVRLGHVALAAGPAAPAQELPSLEKVREHLGGP